MKSTTVYLVQLADSLRDLAMLAAREIFPRAQLVPARSVTEALQLPAHGRQLVVIGETTEHEIGQAAQALDAADLPRWAVVHLGDTPSDLVDTVPPDECTARSLARIFRSALMHHELLRENLQLRGDLKTVSRRLNHDIRTPLGCIDTVCSLLHDIPGADESSAESIRAIRDSTSEISVMLDRVSFMLKATSEPLPGAPVSMGTIVQRAMERLPAQADRRLAKIRQPAQWPEVFAVDHWVEFIWLNLIQNALRHGARNGTVEIGWDARGIEIRFWIASTGLVPSALRQNLLRPFHVLHQNPSAGLGLSLVERLVTLQGGRCGYETSPEERSVFYFTLPATLGLANALPVGSSARPLAATRPV